MLTAMTAMRAELLAVHGHRGLPIRSAQVQQDAFALPGGGHGERAVVRVWFTLCQYQEPV